MNVELKMVRTSFKSIVKMFAIALVVVNLGAGLLFHYGLKENLLDIYPEEWFLLELLSVLLGLLLVFSWSKAEIICYNKNQASGVHQRLGRWLKIKSYSKVRTIGGVEEWNYLSFLNRCLRMFESDIRIESTKGMLKITGPKRYILHIKNKLIWSREFAPTKKKNEEELAEF